MERERRKVVDDQNPRLREESRERLSGSDAGDSGSYHDDVGAIDHCTPERS